MSSSDHEPQIGQTAGLVAFVATLMLAMLAADVVAAQDKAVADTTASGAAGDDEVVVVTASRVEQTLQEAPVAMTVLSGDQFEAMPADDFGDLLRNVPGLNVAQTSGWDISISSRNATNVLPKGQLVLIDGRSIFQDFNGVVWWSAVPFTSGRGEAGRSAPRAGECRLGRERG